MGPVGTVTARITHVAIRHRGKVYSLPAPNRHHHVLWEMRDSGIPRTELGDHEQGFVDESGAFLTRTHAFERAQETGQIKPRVPGNYEGPLLFSEDLW